ncbi:hypothetical protein HDU96_000083 [Phlyctochytrium bullatum]|nr:hypothetical protein HDU96_000083 [Phlyctochytrium bullatum]
MQLLNLLLVACAAISAVVAAPIERRTIPDVPDMSFSPGVLCTPDDPHYMGEFYGIHKCKRNFSRAQKAKVAAFYGLDDSEWPDVEFDHLIPLGIGGANSIHNVWPQRGPAGENESGDKDDVELQAYRLLSSGQISQREAVQMIFDWMNQAYGTTYSTDTFDL